MNTYEMIVILRISDDPQKLAAADELAALLHEEILWQERVGQLEAENARLTAYIARIADDYYPDGDDTAALALSEMREALTALLAREDGE